MRKIPGLHRNIFTCDVHLRMLIKHTFINFSPGFTAVENPVAASNVMQKKKKWRIVLERAVLLEQREIAEDDVVISQPLEKINNSDEKRDEDIGSNAGCCKDLSYGQI